MSGERAEIVQLVPRLDRRGGVSSHALELGRALMAQSGLRTRFVSADEAAPSERDAAVETLPARRAEDLAAAFGGDEGGPVLVHYANYGYAERGCPRWLIDGIERWRAAAPRRRLLTVFHELYATGRPWHSSFWLSPLQRRLAARMARCSDRIVTSLDLYRRILRTWLPDASVTTLPVFSTVGEPAAPPPLRERRRRLVVFGSPGLRARAYTIARRELAHACAVLAVEEIADVGLDTVAPPTFDGTAVRAWGELPADAVSGLLADSVAGFMGYPPDFLGKSTVFAAYAAHRMVPICAWPVNGRAVAAGGDEPSHFWNAGRAPAADWQEIADAARRWYEDHSLAHQATVYAQLLQ